MEDFTDRMLNSRGYELSEGIAREGFQDPNGQYPTEENWFQSVFGKGATGEQINELCIGGGSVGVDLKITPSGPSLYPHVQIIKTTSGHIVQLDDTPGNGRILIKHSEGAGIDCKADGTMIISALHNRVEITGGDQTVIVEGNGQLIYNGNLNIKVAGDFNVDVGGNYNVTANNVRETIKNNRNITSGDTSETIRGTSSKTVSGSVTETILGNRFGTVKGDNKQVTGGNSVATCANSTTITSQADIVVSADNINIAANDLSAFGDTGTIGGQNIHLYGYNAHIEHTVYSETMQADTFYGDLEGNAKTATEAGKAGTAGIIGASGSAGAHTVTARDTAVTALPTAALLADYLNNSANGIRKVKVDVGDHLKNYFDKLRANGYVSDRDLSTGEIRSKLRDKNNAANKDFIANAVSQGKISADIANPVPPAIGRVVAAGPSPKVATTPVGNLPVKSASTAFMPRQLSTQIIPDPQYNPNFLTEVTSATKLGAGVSVAKFLGGHGDPITLDHITNLEDRKALARHLYVHAEIMLTISQSKNPIFKDLRLQVSEGVYKPSKYETLEPDSVNYLASVGRCIFYQLYNNSGRLVVENHFDLVEYWKDAVNYDKLILDYDTLNPDKSLTAQVGLVLPEIGEDWNPTYKREIVTQFNNTLFSKKEAVEVLALPL